MLNIIPEGLTLGADYCYSAGKEAFFVRRIGGRIKEQSCAYARRRVSERGRVDDV